MKLFFAFVAALIAAGAIWWATQNDPEGATIPVFDKAIWIDENKIYDTPHPRVAMVQTLIDDHLSKGMSRAAVEDIIGAPTDTPYFADHDMVYWLGNEPNAYSIDSQWLVLDLDDDGLVAEIQLLTD